MQAYIVRAATPLHGHIKTHLKNNSVFPLHDDYKEDQVFLLSVARSQLDQNKGF